MKILVTGSDRQYHIRIVLCNRFINHPKGLMADRRDFQLDYFGACNFIRQSLNSFNCRVNWFSAKWVESSECLV